MTDDYSIPSHNYRSRDPPCSFSCGLVCDIRLAAGGIFWRAWVVVKQDKLVKLYIIVAIISAAKSKALIKDKLC